MFMSFSDVNTWLHEYPRERLIESLGYFGVFCAILYCSHFFQLNHHCSVQSLLLADVLLGNSNLACSCPIGGFAACRLQPHLWKASIPFIYGKIHALDNDIWQCSLDIQYLKFLFQFLKQSLLFFQLQEVLSAVMGEGDRPLLQHLGTSSFSFWERCSKTASLQRMSYPPIHTPFPWDHIH